LFHQCISHESNAWRKRCVFRPDLKTGKEQGARMWSGNVFQSLGAAALKAAAAEEQVTVRSVIIVISYYCVNRFRMFVNNSGMSIVAINEYMIISVKHTRLVSYEHWMQIFVS